MIRFDFKMDSKDMLLSLLNKKRWCLGWMGYDRSQNVDKNLDGAFILTRLMSTSKREWW